MEWSKPAARMREMVLAMRFGDEPSFVLSSGGFHPAFKDVPRGVPDKLDRLAVSFGVGPIKLRNETYFAITSNSVQSGWKCELSADIEVAAIKGHLSFDALLYLEPKFHFLAEIQFQVSLEAFGEDLCSVRVDRSALPCAISCAASDTPSADDGDHSAPATTLCITVRWVCMHPFGWPVVPEV